MNDIFPDRNFLGNLHLLRYVISHTKVDIAMNFGLEKYFWFCKVEGVYTTIWQLTYDIYKIKKNEVNKIK